jgi:CubicO group peptidase (beta-lactamase class C family)
VYLPGDRAPADLLDTMRYLEPAHELRAAYEYNNLCYNVVGLLIERVSGQSYQAFIRARLADPLGMTVGFSLDDLEAAADAARPYMMQEDSRLPARFPFPAVAAGAINTSIEGLANWMLLHLGKGEFNGERLVPAALIDALQVPRAWYPQPGPPEFGESHYGLGLRAYSYRGDRVVFHGGGLPGWCGRMTLVPDFGIGVAVLTNCSPMNDVPGILIWHVVDRLRGREPIDWRERSRKQREQASAQMQAWKDAREKARHSNTRPAHDLAAYAGGYQHPAYGVMSIEAQGGALHWSWRGMSAGLIHRHFETFELPEGLHPLLPYRLAITFLTDREGDIVSLSAPLEPMVKDIVFVRGAAGGG